MYNQSFLRSNDIALSLSPTNISITGLGVTTTKNVTETFPTKILNHATSSHNDSDSPFSNDSIAVFSNASFPSTLWNESFVTSSMARPSNPDAYYGLASVAFICFCLGCLMYFVGMCKMKKRVTFGDDAAFFQEDQVVPRHRRFTVTQIVYRSAAFLRDLDHDVEKRRQRLTSATAATAAASHLRSSQSFVHVPDILNPIPSGCATPVARRKRAASGTRGIRLGAIRSKSSGSDGDDVIGPQAPPSPSRSNLKLIKSKMHVAGCEWTQFHQNLSSKLARLRKDGLFLESKYQRLPRKHSEQSQQRSGLMKFGASGNRGYVPLMLSDEDDDDDEDDSAAYVAGGSSSEDYPLV